MASRIAALSIGLAAGIATLLFLHLDWNGVLAFLASSGSTGLGAALTEHWPRLAWTGIGAATMFAVAALVVALFGGLIEVLTARARISALRYDPTLAETWNAADWRAAFARTAVSARAEAMIAATVPAADGQARRVVVDTQLLIGMDQFWLDRLALSRIITPLPPLVAGFAATLGLFAFAEGGRWEAVLAAGASAWFVIRLTEYLVRLVLSAAVAAAVESATATLRPMISSRIPALPGRPGGDPAAAGALPATASAPAGPSAPNSPAPGLPAPGSPAPSLPAPSLPAPSLPASEPTREQSVDAAMPEIRASIERLLTGNPDRAAPPR